MNKLSTQTSPYLLQHKNNPVDWYPWGEEALLKAKSENKLLLISIGYSSCHWCHVMEHESFENKEVAEVMNRHFVNIKIDREERPDIDAVYMEAVQLMTGRGGWPLNCFALPDGKPIYGGTYFPKHAWKSLLLQLADLWKNEKDRALQYADELTKGISQQPIVASKDARTDYQALLRHTLQKWKPRLDNVEGGPNRAPKFPLPSDYVFLMREAFRTDDDSLKQHVFLTLEKMAFGGIFDQAGGGFARYSVDERWKVPHFEKMLYDNAQLIALYAEAFRMQPEPLYKEVCYQTLQWLLSEMKQEQGGFFAALDADSEGEEGKFYVWKEEELKAVLGKDYSFAKTYYNVNEEGYWEHGNYILLRTQSDENVAQKLKVQVSEVKKRAEAVREKLMAARSKRIRPGLDNKVLLSWNAQLIAAFCEAYWAFGDEVWLHEAEATVQFIEKHLKHSPHTYYHVCTQGKAHIEAFADDYAFYASATLKLFQCTANPSYLALSQTCIETLMKQFASDQSPLFYYTSVAAEPLISRRTEYMDNVIPAANSEAALVLFLLSRINGNTAYHDRAIQMLKAVMQAISDYGSAFSNWCKLAQWLCSDFTEVIFTGAKAKQAAERHQRHYAPFSMLLWSETPNEISIFHQRFDVSGKTMQYVCRNGVCNLPKVWKE